MKFEDKILALYKNDKNSLDRYRKLLNEYEKTYGKNDEYEFFTSSGRTEIIGNHTDHNYGKVVCASISLDSIAVATKNDENKVKIRSIEYNQYYEISLDDLEPKHNETWSCILVKGMLTAFKKIGNIGGLNICISSNVIASSGVSSSASFEMLIGSIINSYYNEDKLDVISIAKTGQYSENKNWNKKSGLLDQIACAYGGLISIDFKDIKNPKITKLNASDIENMYDIILVPTGGSHESLSDEYSAIPNEMISIANTQLRNIDKDFVIDNMNKIRKNCGDRAVLRALHFFDENDRVDDLIVAIENKKYDKFLDIIEKSGDSSWKYLQNCYVSAYPNVQPISIMLALTKEYINKNNIKGTCRIHGGGFAGVIMAMLPKSDSDNYIKFISKYVNDKIYKVNIREYGAINIKNVKNMI